MNSTTEAFILKLVYSFGRAFLAVFIAGLAGLGTVPSWSAAKAAVIALIVAGVAAGIRAVQAALLDPAPTVPTDNVP